MKSTCGPDVPVGQRAIFLDRDGVLNDPAPQPGGGPPESPLDPELVRLSDGAVAGVAALRTAGFALVVVSNQPGAAKEQCTRQSLDAVHERVAELLRTAGAEIDAWYYCYHHPAGSRPDLAGHCACRKPEPGLLFAAAEDLGLDLNTSWMIGDSDADVVAGSRAGCRTVLVEHPETAHRRGSAVPDLRAANLAAAWDAMQGLTSLRSHFAVDA